jgi:hypothetical protein
LAGQPANQKLPGALPNGDIYLALARRLLGLPDDYVDPTTEPLKAEQKQRSQHMGTDLSATYQSHHFHHVSGFQRGQSMFCATDQSFIDLDCHPGSRQIKRRHQIRDRGSVGEFSWLIIDDDVHGIIPIGSDWKRDNPNNLSKFMVLDSL